MIRSFFAASSLALVVAACAASTTEETDRAASPIAALDAPKIVAPADGQRLDVEGSYIFSVAGSPAAEGIRCTITDDRGDPLWDSLRDDHRLSPPKECRVDPGSAAFARFHPGHYRLTVVERVRGLDSEPAYREFELVAPAPTTIYPSLGQTLRTNGDYMFAVNQPKDSDGVVCGIRQGDRTVWFAGEDYAHLAKDGRCTLRWATRSFDEIQPGPATFVAWASASREYEDETGHAMRFEWDTEHLEMPIEIAQ